MTADSNDSQGQDGALLLTVLCWAGLAIAALDAFLQPLPPGLTWAAFALAYLAGGVPAARAALIKLWQDHRLDIDLLMVVAAVTAAAVGAALEGAAHCWTC